MRHTYQKEKTIARGRTIRDFYLSFKKTIKENVIVRIVPLLLLSIFLTVPAFTDAAAQEAVADDGVKLKVQESYGKLPLHPFDGRSQMDGRFRYFEKGIGHTTYFPKENVPLSFVQGIKPEIRSHRLSPSPVFVGPHASAEAGAKPFKNGNIYPPYPDKTSDLRYRHEFSESAGFNLYSEQKSGLFTLREAATPENNIIYASAGGSISGRVTDSSGAGIQNIRVEVYGANRWWISGASTDTNGNYTVTGLPTGQHKVQFYGSNLGYVNEWYDNKPNFGNADTVSVTDPNTTSGIDAVLELGGSISGRVTDSSGAGIQNIRVEVYGANGWWISGASTDTNGNYTVTGLPTGQHKVQFYGSNLGYVNEWYDNKPNFGNADNIPVTALYTTSGIDAVLEVGGSISGRITDSSGTGIQNVWVHIYDTNWNWISNTSTDANGNYTVTGIPTGQHKVQFYGSNLGYVNEWYDNKPDFGNADTVPVTAPNTTSGIDAVLELGGSISGRVTDSTGAGIQNVWVTIYKYNTNYYEWISNASTDANGNYTVIGIPTGVYKVEFYGRHLGYINEWYDNKPDIGNADTVAVTAPNATVGFDAVLELGGSISGSVTDSTGAGIQNVMVTIYDTNYGWISGTYTDANGNYTVIGITTGQYKVRFFDVNNMGYINEWYNSKNDFGNADPVAVTAPNATTGIDAVLEIGGSISGSVTDSTGAGIQNVGVTIYKYNTNYYEWISNASTDANGNYTAIGIPTGVYKLEFYGRHLGYINEWYDNKPDIGNADFVSVIAPNAITGIDAVLELGGSISGRVTDSTGTGIQNVWVDIINTNGEWISWASTDTNGNYTAGGVPTGVYKVEFYGSNLGYLNEWYNNKLDLCNADAVAVIAPNAITGIDAVLEVGGSISGKVTDSTGVGIQNVWVDIINTNDEWISYASTDANGNYTAIGIPTGAYKVSFYGSDLGYVHEWYNNKPDIGNANFVSVTAPNATAGIDAVLEVGGSISGRVTDLTGTGIQNVYVDIINTNGEWISWASTDANGNYTAGGVPTGAHKVRFYDWYLGYINEWYNNKPDFGNADAVAVTAPNATTGIDAVLEPGGSGSISGRVTDSTGTGIQNAWVKVYDTNWGQWVSWAPLDADGNYTATGLSTGQYKVQFFYYGCSGYLSEWYNNKPDFGSADTVLVTAPNATAGIDAVLSVKTWFEENDPAITYTGTWKNYTCATCRGGAMKYSGQTGAKADFSFNGTGIKWIVTKANLLGKARVYLDGVNMGLVDLYNPTAKYQVVLQKTGLTPGNHTLTIEVSGQKNPASTGYFIDIDAFEVVP